MRRVFHPIDFTKTDSQTIMAKNILIYTEIQKKQTSTQANWPQVSYMLAFGRT